MEGDPYYVWTYRESKAILEFPVQKGVGTEPDLTYYPSRNKRGLRIHDVFKFSFQTLDTIDTLPNGFAEQLLKDGIALYCPSGSCLVRAHDTSNSLGTRMIALAIVLGASLQADIEDAKKTLRVALFVKDDCLVQLLMSKKVEISDVE